MSYNSHQNTVKLSFLIQENLQGDLAQKPIVHLLLNNHPKQQIRGCILRKKTLEFRRQERESC